MKKILITGANGYVASRIIPHLEKKYELTLVDIEFNKKFNSKIIKMNLSDSSVEDIEKIVKGHQSIIHLAYIRPDHERNSKNTNNELNSFDQENRNVIMANKIYKAALTQNIDRVVVASSNHAADWYEHHEIHEKKLDLVNTNMIPYSDNFYGWAKASYELLSLPYASGKFGRKIEFVHVRIGFPREIDESLQNNKFISNKNGEGIRNIKRHLGAYISQNDLSNLFDKSLSAEEIKGDLQDVPFLVVYGVSDNTRRFWSLESARKNLNFYPKDDSEKKFQSFIKSYEKTDEWEGKLG
ncbi:NAD(P)-dependent oxidoreductase [Chloroflexi bacterium]|nr:NAD(P)-dependent oxidoreductase [Chloroflexota bacterium]RZP12600.1 MAG: NAD(P)-dependent oxidoreductase [Chloroflexota bacterium]|tara:strand:- start:6650 stop:7540 length:891 start_codon:yes stop_codon:yes gene_type:complete